MNIIHIQEAHYAEIANIYLQGIATGNDTFQTQAPTWEAWHQNHLQHSRFVAFIDNEMVGWAALSQVSNRCVYAGVAEVSVYVASNFFGKGIGFQLLQQLILDSEQNGLWTLQSGIFPENIASIKLHKKCDFRKIGYREKIGQMKDVWRDTVIMERRSKTVGI